LRATDVEIVKKVSLTKNQKGKPANLPNKPNKEEDPINTATGILGQQTTGNKYAIIIGISDSYPGTANDLKYTDNDALAMRNVLVSKYNFTNDNIYLLTDGDVASENPGIIYGNPTVENINNVIIDLRDNRNLTSSDEVVFFYSGHGGKGKADDGDSEAIDESIISHDGNNLVHIWDGQLKTLFSEYATNRIVFFFDSCVSGGMTDLAGTGRIINMATLEKRFDTAVEGIYVDEDGTEVGAGEFTYHFVIKGMGEGLAEGDDDTPDVSDVTVEEAFDYAKANVITDHPTISDKFENDFLL